MSQKVASPVLIESWLEALEDVIEKHPTRLHKHVCLTKVAVSDYPCYLCLVESKLELAQDLEEAVSAATGGNAEAAGS